MPKDSYSSHYLIAILLIKAKNCFILIDQAAYAYVSSLLSFVLAYALYANVLSKLFV